MESQQRTEIVQILSAQHKEDIGELLSIEEQVSLNNFKIKCINEFIDKHVLSRIQTLEESLTNHQEPKKPKGIYTINEMYFVQEYEYKDKKFASFMVRVDGDDTLYTWDRVVPIKKPISAGDVIYCEIENDKLRNVKQLQNI